MQCRCGKVYYNPPAKFRKDSAEICPMCGMKEALQAAVAAGALTSGISEQMMILGETYEKDINGS